MLKCCVRLSEVPLHLYQILAGFELLRRSGKIELEIIKLPSGSPHKLPYNMLEAQCNGRTFIFDMNDGYDNLLKPMENYIDFYNSLLKKCDFLYKRSYREDLNALLKSPGKVQKTAPNYFTTVKSNPAHLPVPCDPSKEKAKKIIRLLPLTQYYNGYNFERNFRSKPLAHTEPAILFMARFWDPKGEYKGQLTAQKSEERKEINEMRAKCIRLCRTEFGSRFTGGVALSDYAIQEYPDLVLEKSGVAKKHEYLKHMKNSDILVATAGLHQSTGWKFAEYIAASKAIVSEPLYYESVGDLTDGKNYLSFTDEFQCCERITELFDEQRRYSMMCANKDYYDSYMSVEKIAAQTLQIEERGELFAASNRFHADL